MPTTTKSRGRGTNHDHADELFQTHIGGAAMLEGVMMRGRYNWAVAVREPDGGIYVEEHDVPGYGKRQPWRRWPLVRGCVSLFESLLLQYKAMQITADHAYDFDDEDDSRGGRGNPQCSDSPRDAARRCGTAPEECPDPSVGLSSREPIKTGLGDGAEGLRESGEDCLSTEKSQSGQGEGADQGFSTWMTISMVVGVVLGVALFVLVPAFVTNLLVGDYSAENMLVWNLVDGVLRAGIFVLYMWLISLMPDIKKMFCYHGAEHKTIHCFEHGLELTPANARDFSRQHVRCGTAFLIMTLIVSIIVFTVFPTDALATALGLGAGLGRFAVVVLSRIVLIPLVAGLSYEVTVRWAGSHPDNPLVKVVLAPGMAMQLITTNEPDDGQLECAIAAMKAVVAREEAEEAAKA